MRDKDTTQQVQENKLRLSFAFQENLGSEGCKFSFHIPSQELQMKGRETITNELELMLEAEFLQYKMEMNEKEMCRELLKSFSAALIDGLEIWREGDFKKKISWPLQTGIRLLSFLSNKFSDADREEFKFIFSILEKLIGSLSEEKIEENPINLQKCIEQMLLKMNLEDGSHSKEKLLIDIPKIATEMLQSIKDTNPENIMEVVYKLIVDIQMLINDENQEASSEETSESERDDNEKQSSTITLPNETKAAEQNFLEQFENSIFAMKWKPRLTKGKLIHYSEKQSQYPEKPYYLTKNSFLICMNIRQSREDGSIQETMEAINNILKKSSTQKKQSWSWQEKLKAFFLRKTETQKNYDELYSQFMTFKKNSSR